MPSMPYYDDPRVDSPEVATEEHRVFRLPSRNVNILYVCGTYAPSAFAGSELSAHELLRHLQADGSARVLVVTDEQYTGGHPGEAEIDGVSIVGIRHQDRRESLDNVVERFQPDVIFTQLLWANVAMEAGERHGVPTVYRIPSFADRLDIQRPSALVAISRDLCDWVRDRSGRSCRYILSTIDLDRVVAPSNHRKPRYITMFNPIRDKGGPILRSVAEALSDREFAFVRGWHSLRNQDGSWNRDRIRRSLQSQHMDHLDWMPEDVDLSDLPNVRELQPTAEVGRIFARIRILLVPSRYRESLARVAVEAYANGIPVIGSKVGGLQEHVARAGILVEDFSNPVAWVRAIRSLDDPATYEDCSRRALRYIEEEFSNEITARRFMELFSQVIERGRIE